MLEFEKKEIASKLREIVKILEKVGVNSNEEFCGLAVGDQESVIRVFFDVFENCVESDYEYSLNYEKIDQMDIFWIEWEEGYVNDSGDLIIDDDHWFCIEFGRAKDNKWKMNYTRWGRMLRETICTDGIDCLWSHVRDCEHFYEELRK